MSTAAILKRLLAPLERRVRGLATRVRLTGTRDGGGLQLVSLEGLAGERLPNIVRLQQFGASGHAPKGSTGLLVAIGGARSSALLIALDHPGSRPTDLQEGEYRIYNAHGDYVHLAADGQMTLKARTKVLIDAPDAEFTGNVSIAGALAVAGDIDSASTVTGAVDVIAAGISGKNHDHNETGSVTSAPNP